MASKKLFIGIFLILITCTNKVVGQNIELEEVYVDCVERTHDSTVQYEPYRISFLFRAMNETSDILAIGAYNAPPRGEPARFGYFEFETNTGMKFRLYSIDKIRYVLPNDTISLTADLIEGNKDFDLDFLKQFKSKPDIRDYMINSSFSYTCLEEDYTDTDACKIVFRSQEINMKRYFIVFVSEGQVIQYYYIE